MMLRALYVGLGSLSLLLGVLGIFVPVLPTTPFLLLSAGLYVRSSDRLYQSLIHNRYLGQRIREYHEKRGLSKREKVSAMLLMWLMVMMSYFFLIDRLWMQILTISLGMVGSLVMGLWIPTRNC